MNMGNLDILTDELEVEKFSFDKRTHWFFTKTAKFTHCGIPLRELIYCGGEIVKSLSDIKPVINDCQKCIAKMLEIYK